MGLKVEDLEVGNYIAFKSLKNVETVHWEVEIDTPYKITGFGGYEDVYLDIIDRDGDYFYVDVLELEDAYIAYKEPIIIQNWSDNSAEWSLVSNPKVNSLDTTVSTLEILAKYYDNIPSELIKELILMNKTKLIVK